MDERQQLRGAGPTATPGAGAPPDAAPTAAVRAPSVEVPRSDTLLVGGDGELGETASALSHDLREPLHAADGLARLLADRHADGLGPEGARLVARLGAQVARMTRLVAGLDELARVERSERHDALLDMTTLARSVLERALAAAPGRALATTVRPLPPARGDPTLLRQVLANLVDNALKFTRPHASAAIEIGGARPPGEVAFYVRDDGIGFDPRHATRLFSPFRRLHGDPELTGTGIGLAVAWRIVRRHGGRVWAEGAVERGATFWFALPAPPRAVVPHEEPA